VELLTVGTLTQRDRVEPEDFVAEGFLDQWLICGPFYSDRGWATLDEDYLFGEAAVRPHQGLLTFGKMWQPWKTVDHFVQFLFAPFEHTLFVTGYAHTYVYVPAETDALLLSGSDDGIKIWVNGTVVWRNDINRAAKAGDDKAKIRLAAGWNSLLVKVRQGMAHWQFVAQLVDLEQNPIPGLKTALEGENQPASHISASLGVRPRFKVETWDYTDTGFVRNIEFEIGNLGQAALSDVAITIAGVNIVFGSLESGETKTISKRLPIDGAVAVMRNAIQGNVGGKIVETQTIVSQSSRLLRDLFAPFFVPTGQTAKPPDLLAGFTWDKFTSDSSGDYMLIDPPGLRFYLGGLVGRFPMNSGLAICSDLLELALSGKVDDFKRVLTGAKLSPMEVA